MLDGVRKEIPKEVANVRFVRLDRRFERHVDGRVVGVRFVRSAEWANPNADPDGDDRPNRYEATMNTDPGNPDIDGEEYVAETDPCDPDDSP